jgi:hypothetical protein
MSILTGFAYWIVKTTPDMEKGPSARPWGLARSLHPTVQRVGREIRNKP